MTLPACSPPSSANEAFELHQRACELVEAGEFEGAGKLYRQLRTGDLPPGLDRLVRNNQAVLAALEGNSMSAVDQLQIALTHDPDFSVAIENLKLLKATDSNREMGQGEDRTRPPRRSGTRIVLLSFFFNWPSPAGGIVHTVELARFLSHAGYDVTLLHAGYDSWQIGQVQDCPVPAQTVPFRDADWNRPAIQRRFREVVDGLQPECIIITDCWNFKPHLVEALSGYRVFLRMQAHECLCPLNNLRIQPEAGGMRQCPLHQLVAREECMNCLARFDAYSGPLHRLDRELSEVTSPGYEALLRRSLQDAEAVLVLNPLIAEVLRPYCRRVETITWGMDADRFPETTARPDAKPVRILFAGLREEPIKGFEILRSAGRRLWQKRQDWELVVTGDSPAAPEPFARYVGWQSQADLPALYRDTDIVAVPTLVQDGLSRTAVEGMAAGRPVVASRLGAMPFLISEGVTGLLCQAGDPDDWADTLDRLLDEPKWREELGRNGRRVFCERFSWERVIEGDYRPLLSRQMA